jgi:type IV secretory pathway VirB10-like protein
MVTWERVYVSAACLGLLCCSVRTNLAEDRPTDLGAVPLTVPIGAPLHIVLTKKVPVNHPGVPVEGKVAENVYVFDHLVIPAGSRVMGQVTKVDNAPHKERALAIANGNFTPLRRAHVDFNTLVEVEGKRIPMQTNVSQGAPSLVHMVAGGNEKKKKGRVASKVEQVHQQVLNQEEAAINNVTAPGKVQRLKAALSARLPYHRPSLPVGTNFTAELKTSLAFGTETPSAKQLEKMGGAIPPGSLVHVRLVSPLSSATDHRETPVRAVVSQPLFSSDHTLILPEGARLDGTITEAVPARLFGRNGQLRFTFRQLELTSGAIRKVEASLQGIDADSANHLQLDSEGGAHAVTPKTNYVMPAIDVFLAATSLDLDGGRGIHGGTVGHGADYGGATIRGGASLGFAGAVISLLAHSRPVSAGFAFYGAGWAVYSHFVARGVDVVFPKNTPMEIRFGTHGGSTPAHPGSNFVSQVAEPSKIS